MAREGQVQTSGVCKQRFLRGVLMSSRNVVLIVLTLGLILIIAAESQAQRKDECRDWEYLYGPRKTADSCKVKNTSDTSAFGDSGNAASASSSSAGSQGKARPYVQEQDPRVYRKESKYGKSHGYNRGLFSQINSGYRSHAFGRSHRR